jgi:RNA polymerase sigma-70 factor (ECF subfamily)
MIAAERIAVGRTLATAAEPFSAFVQARREQAVRVAYRLLGGDQAAAEDVAQNAFLRAHRALPSFRGAAALDTWFYRILVREVQRHRRWRFVRRIVGGGDEADPRFEPIDPRPEGDVLLRRRIADAVAKLSPAQRDAFVLVHLEGLSLGETATVLGKAVGTVKSHLHRGLESLRRELADLAIDLVDRERGRAS